MFSSISPLMKQVENELSERRVGFNLTHVLNILLQLTKERFLSRKELSKRIGIGEGSIRTLIRLLARYRLIETFKSGVCLTDLGKEMVLSKFPRMASIKAGKLTIGKFNKAIHVKDCSERVKDGLKQRDAALIHGGKGATTIVYRNNELVIPPTWERVRDRDPETYKELISLFKLEEGDVIVIGTGDSRKNAEISAIAGSLTLL